MSASCPACRRTKVQSSGQICAGCIKAGIEPPRVEGAPRPTDERSPYEVLADQLRLLRMQQAQIAKALEAPSFADEANTLRRQNVELSRAIGDVTKNMLLWREAGVKAMESVSREQMIETIAKWFARQPPEDQRELIKQLTRVHNKERKAS